jgi:hypothetical protein
MTAAIKQRTHELIEASLRHTGCITSAAAFNKTSIPQLSWLTNKVFSRDYISIPRQ